MSHTRSRKRAKLASSKDGSVPYELDFTLKVVSAQDILSLDFVDERDENEAEKTNGKEGKKNFAQVTDLFLTNCHFKFITTFFGVPKKDRPVQL